MLSEARRPRRLTELFGNIRRVLRAVARPGRYGSAARPDGRRPAAFTASLVGHYQPPLPYGSDMITQRDAAEAEAPVIRSIFARFMADHVRATIGATDDGSAVIASLAGHFPAWAISELLDEIIADLSSPPPRP